MFPPGFVPQSITNPIDGTRTPLNGSSPLPSLPGGNLSGSAYKRQSVAGNGGTSSQRQSVYGNPLTSEGNSSSTPRSQAPVIPSMTPRQQHMTPRIQTTVPRQQGAPTPPAFIYSPAGTGPVVLPGGMTPIADMSSLPAGFVPDPQFVVVPSAGVSPAFSQRGLQGTATPVVDLASLPAGFVPDRQFTVVAGSSSASPFMPPQSLGRADADDSDEDKIDRFDPTTTQNTLLNSATSANAAKGKAKKKKGKR